MADYTLSVKIEGDESDFNSAMRSVQGALSGTNKSLGEGGSKASIFGDVLKANLLSNVITGGFNLLKSGIQNVANALGGLVDDLSESSAAWKTFEANASTKHSQDEIQAVKKKLQDFATATIYSSSDMASTYAQLDAVGVASAENLVMAFGGLASAAENPTQAMKTLSTQATQMAAKPKVAWEDFKLMLEQSPAGMAAVAEQMGMSTQDLIKNIQAGTVSTNDFFAAVERAGTSDKFTNMATEYKTVGQAMDGLRETIVNKLQPAFDSVSQIGIKAVSGIADTLDGANFGGLVESMLPAFQALADAFVYLTQQAVAWAQTVDWAAVGQSISDSIISIVQGIVSFDWMGFFSTIGAGMGLLIDALSWVVNNWQIILTGIEAIGIAMAAMQLVSFISNIISIVTAISGAITAVGGIGAALTAFCLPVAAAIAAIIAIIAIIKNWDVITETIATVWETVKTTVLNIWNTIKTKFIEIFTAILNNPVVQLIVEYVSKQFTNLKNTITGIWEGIKSIASGAWELIKNIILGPVLLLCDLVTGDFDKLKEDASKIFNNLKEAAGKIWDGIKQVIGSFVTGMVDSVKNKLQMIPGIFSEIFGKVKDFVTGLPSQALQWGRDIVDGIADGIRNAIGHVTDAVSGVADKIRSFLHFSEPDVGPLSDFHTYMPDMMAGLVGGIKAGIPMLQKAAGLAAGAISGGLSGTITTDGIVGATAGSYYNESYGNTTSYGATTINVYGAPGQDTATLAEEVSEIIFDRVRREAYV